MLWTMAERERDFEKGAVLPHPVAQDAEPASWTRNQAPKTAAVVLAAGMATRLDGQPKPLLQIDGVPLVRHLVSALSDVGICRVAVVTGHRAEEIEAALADCTVALVRNPHYAGGQLSSLRAGLAALPRELDAILIALADQPLLTARDLDALLAAFARRGDADIVRPRSQGRFGNPIVMAAGLLDAVTQGPPDAGLRHWMLRNPGRVTHFDTDCEHYFVDIDTPEDLQRVRLCHGRDVRLPHGAPHG